ncbi:MAG: glycosyl transferase [Gemmatimonadetes bacterium]|nr:glycosyl transferase [Gemmatimonadota bacterium]
MSKSPDLSLVIPAYNEQGRIASSLDAIADFLGRRDGDSELIVVDDGSVDGTARVVRSHAAFGGLLRLIQLPANRGKGAAIREGVLASRGRRVLFSDADLSTPLSELAKLEAALADGIEIAVASRARRGAELRERQPFYRVLMGKTFNKMVQLFATPGIADTQCGFKLFDGDVARRVFTLSKIDGFGFDVEILFLARTAGFSIREIPVVWINDPHSTVNPIRDSILTFLDLVRIRIHRYDPLPPPSTPDTE